MRISCGTGPSWAQVEPAKWGRTRTLSQRCFIWLNQWKAYGKRDIERAWDVACLLVGGAGMNVFGGLLLIAPFGIERNIGAGLGSLFFGAITWRVNYEKLRRKEQG